MWMRACECCIKVSGVYRQSGYIYTNYDLLVMHAIYCDGGNDGRGNNLPESTGHTVNHEMETPLNFKMRTLERPETVTAATTAAAMTCLKTRSSDSGQLVTL